VVDDAAGMRRKEGLVLGRIVSWRTTWGRPVGDSCDGGGVRCDAMRCDAAHGKYWSKRSRPAVLYDCFIFHFELDLLEARYVRAAGTAGSGRTGRPPSPLRANKQTGAVDRLRKVDGQGDQAETACLPSSPTGHRAVPLGTSL
jgi:hypothetical protein